MRGVLLFLLRKIIARSAIEFTTAKAAVRIVAIISKVWVKLLAVFEILSIIRSPQYAELFSS